MPHGTFGSAIGVSICARESDGYMESVILTIGPLNILVEPRKAIEIADGIIERARLILAQSAAPCGCDAKVGWICEKHRANVGTVTRES